jgi:hypothetical protein
LILVAANPSWTPVALTLSSIGTAPTKRQFITRTDRSENPVALGGVASKKHRSRTCCPTASPI